MTTLLFAVASIGIYAFFSLFWTIPRTKLDPEATAGGISLISTFGPVGGMISPVFVGWMRELTGSFYGALGVLGGTFCLSMLALYYCTSDALTALPTGKPRETTAA